jgi:hypothetical protein
MYVCMYVCYFQAMVTRNYTIAADTTKTLRPDTKLEPEVPEVEASSSKPKKIPRYMEPNVVENVVSLGDPTRNKMKHRYRLIVGKYAFLNAVEYTSHFLFPKG